MGLALLGMRGSRVVDHAIGWDEQLRSCRSKAFCLGLVQPTLALNLQLLWLARQWLLRAFLCLRWSAVEKLSTDGCIAGSSRRNPAKAFLRTKL